MTKRELYKYLDRKHQERLEKLEKEKRQTMDDKIQELILDAEINLLAEEVSSCCKRALEAYDKYIPCSTAEGWNSVKEQLQNMSNVDDVARIIRKNEAIGYEELKEIEVKFAGLKNDINVTFNKLQVLVADSPNAKEAAKELDKLGFKDMIYHKEDREAFSSELLFGKKEEAL